jgi:hypothetical protein
VREQSLDGAQRDDEVGNNLLGLAHTERDSARVG